MRPRMDPTHGSLSSRNERAVRRVIELAHGQACDDVEVGSGAGAEAADGGLGLLQQPVHGLDKGIAAVIDHATHNDLLALGLRGDQLLERLQPTAPSPTRPGFEVRYSLLGAVLRAGCVRARARMPLAARALATTTVRC